MYKGKDLKEFDKNVKFAEALEKSEGFKSLKDWYVLIAHQEIQGIFGPEEFEKCINYGYAQFKLYPFVVRQMHHIYSIPFAIN